MAKTPRNRKQDGPVQYFLNTAPSLLKDVVRSSISTIARLSTDGAHNSAREATLKLLSSKGINVPDTMLEAEAFDRQIGLYIESFQRVANGAYTVRTSPAKGGGLDFLLLPPENAGSIFLYRNNDNYPFGQTMPDTLSKADSLKPILAMLEHVGVMVKPTDALQYVEVDVRDIDADSFTPSLTSAGLSKNYMSIKLDNEVSKFTTPDAYRVRMGFEVEIEGDDYMSLGVVIRPYAKISMKKDTVDKIVVTDKENSRPYLANLWIKNAIKFSKDAMFKRWDNQPIHDMRATETLLKNVSRAHGNIKPRVNKEGFCIGGTGIPLFIPDVSSQLGAFMDDMTEAPLGNNNSYMFEEQNVKWANTVLSVDWFNDVLTFTDAAGNVRHHRMLGYIALNLSSEYHLLNAPITDMIMVQTYSTLDKLMTGLVSPADIIPHLPEDMRNDNIRGFSAVLSEVLAKPTPGMSTTDNGHPHQNNFTPRVKHFLGLDLSEHLPADQYNCLIIHAYLKTLYSKRKSIDLTPIDRMMGVEYLLNKAAMTQTSYDSLKSNAIIERQKRKQQPLMQDIAVPNLDAGGNLKGYMPHQVKSISNFVSQADNSLLESSPGGGKSLMLIVKAMMSKQEKPKKRVLFITKPRLVAGLVSEINFFSKGKINAVALRAGTLNLMKTRAGIDTYAKFIKWFEALPPNTLFLTGYTDFTRKKKIYEDLDMPDRMLGVDIGLTQYLHIIRMLNFEVVEADESHLIKNKDSQRSEYTYSAMSYANSKTLASGTFLTNTVLDAVGQGFSINPMIFGTNVEAFKARFNLSSGIIKDDDTAAAISNRMDAFVQKSVSYKEDWSFVLPDLRDEIIYSVLTPKQTTFYNILLQQAQLEMQERLKGKSVEDKGSEDAEDEEFEDEDERIMRAAELSLAKAEMFLVAPDSNADYVGWAERPTGNDLISPNILAMDSYLDKAFSDSSGDFSKDKAAMFGIHKVASQHVMKHSRYAKRMIHYTTGNEEAIRRFKTDPDIWILTADSTSLREGENLQLLSHVLDMQAPWSPGDYEQLVSRMYRPDPKGTFAKDYVEHRWFQVDRGNGAPGIGSIKLARMISKAISLARVKYAGDPRWDKQIGPEMEGLDLLSMSMDLLFNTEPSDLYPYLSQWKKFTDWETKLNQVSRRVLATQIESENPGIKLLSNDGKILDRAQFTKLAMREAKPAPDLPGSRKAFHIWTNGATPADPYDLGLEILGSQPIEVGTYVMTEYGPAIVMKVSNRSIVVEAYGLKKVIINRQRIARPSSEEGKLKLANIISNPVAWKAEVSHIPLERLDDVDESASLSPIKSKTKIKKPKKLSEVVEEDEDELDDLDTDDTLDFEDLNEIHTMLINTLPTLGIDNAPSIIEDMGWRKLDPFFTVRPTSWAAAEKVIEFLRKKFHLSNKDRDLLIEEMEVIRDGRAMKLTKVIPPNKIRNFFLENQRKVKPSKTGVPGVKPYWLVVGNEVRLAFSTRIHAPAVKASMKRVATKSSQLRYKELEPMHIKVFSSVKEAYNEVKTLGKRFNVPQDQIKEELLEVRDEIRDLKKKKTTLKKG